MAVHAAVDEGVKPAVLQAVLNRHYEKLLESVALVVRFSKAVLAMDGSEETVRREIQTRFGEAALAELAHAIASVHVFSAVESALGVALSCSVTKITVGRDHSPMTAR